MDDKYRRAFTATILTYISTAKELGEDPLGLAKLPLAASIVTGRELSLRLGRTVDGDKDSLYWVAISPESGAITGYSMIAPDLSKFRAGMNKQLKSWGKKSEIKQLMTKRAVNAGIVAAVVTAAVILTVVTVGTGGAALASAGTAVAKGASAAAKAAGPLIKSALTKASGGALQQALGAVTKAGSKGGSLDDMASAAKSAVPPEKAEALEAQGQQTAAQAEAGFTTGQIAVGVGVGVAGLAAAGTAVYLMTRK